MFNKKLCIFTFAFLLMIFAGCRTKSFAVLPEIRQDLFLDIEKDYDECEKDGCSEECVIKRVSLRDKFKRTPEAQVNAFLKKYNRYSMSANTDKLKSLYSDSYVNNDGFDKETVIDIVKMSKDAYKNIKFETDIESIRITGNYAVVKVKETASGETAKELEKIKGTGSIVSEIRYTDYLQKEKNQWKITATDVSYEKVFLKYGEAKYMEIDIEAPDCVPADSDYEVNIKTVLPGGSFVVGSIVNEDIVYPQENKKDIYRNIKKDSLSRILRANNSEHNEYATVSIAVTRANVEPPAVKIDMTGAAFVMKRVNVLSAANNNTTERE